MKPKKYTLTVHFATLDDAVAFANAVAPAGMAVYYGDVLDREFSGSVPKGSLVLRRDGHKPEDMKVKV
jgi:glucose/arabinose dehydrogenase